MPVDFRKCSYTATLNLVRHSLKQISLQNMLALKIFLIFFTIQLSLEEECTISTKNCLWKKPGEPSLIVNASSGGFCNKIFNAVVLLTLKLYMNVSIFMPQDHLNMLKKVFPYMEILPAEDHICNFTQNYADFLVNLKIDEHLKIANLIRKREKNPMKTFETAEDGSLIIPEKYMFHEYLAEIYAEDSYRTARENSMGPHWTVFYERKLILLEERNLTKSNSILIYHPGFDFKNVRTKGFVDKFNANFRFDPKHELKANKTLHKIKAKLGYKDPVWVGIHVRKSDYVTYELSMKYEPLKPSYYIQAMETYRLHFNQDKLVFIIITDDVEWCKKHIKKKHKDVFIVSNPKLETYDGIGHDLSIISKTNHTIISRGSFSYFSSIFAGDGATFLPCHFEAYKHENRNIDICDRHPLKQPLSRFYTYQT